MSKELEINKCISMKVLLERSMEEGESSLNLIEHNELNEHLIGCSDCKTWQAQTKDLISMARSMPQFDIPEALTQRILAAVDLEAKSSRLSLPATLMGLATALLTIVLVVYSGEGLAGVGSWAICLAAMALLKDFVSAPEMGEQAVR